MAFVKGSSFVLRMEDQGTPGTYNVLGALRANSLSINNSTVDVTNKSSAGWTQLLTAGAIKSMTMSGDGIYDETLAVMEDLVAVANGADPEANFQISEGTNRFSGNFQITDFSMEGPHDGVVTYSISLTSNGAITFAVDA